VNVADKRCENGHFIDESWDICPYCPNDAAEPEIPVVRPRSMEVAAASAAPSPAAAAAVREPSIRPVTASRPAPVPSAVPSLAPALQVAVAAPSSQPERTVAASRGDLGQLKRYVVGWLVGINGSTRGESYPVRMGRNVIGRDKRSDIVVNDDQASSHHADLVFRPEERRFILMDHNSTNGTYVNEAEIEPRRDLAGKDVVRIGSHRFIFMPLCHEGFHWDDEGPLK
jgi:FHA domain